MTVYATDVFAVAEAYLGHGYAIWGCRCETWCGRQDCSGLISMAMNGAGYPSHVCTSSFGFAQWIRDTGNLISEDEAVWTRGAVGIENAWGVPSGWSGRNGHIVMFSGDGFSTVEEMNTLMGCVRGPARGRGFNAWGRLPGVVYQPKPPPPPPPPPPKVPPMFSPALNFPPIVASLDRPGGGVWLAADNGRVWFVHGTGVRLGGLISTRDRAAFAGRHVAKLENRSWTDAAGTHTGFTVIATTGERYVPEGQH